VRLPRHTVLLTPIPLVAGLLIAAAPALGAESRWSSTGAQQPGTPDRPVWSIVAAPAHPSTLLMATQGRGILRSTDSGATWTVAISGVDAGWVVRFDPQQPSTVYAGTQGAGFYKSVDEGKTWTPQNQGLNNLDVRSIDAISGLIVAGTSRGVYYSDDSAASWHSLGLETSSISAVALLSRANSTTIFAGADNGTVSAGYLMSTQGLGGSWALVKGSFPAEALVASLAVGSAPSGGSDPPVIAGTSDGLFRSDDRGASWNALAGLPATDFNVALFNPANPDQIYVASDGDQGNGGVFRSLDRGASWTTFAAGLPVKPRVTALAIQPLNPALLVAATWNPTDGLVGTYQIADPAAAVAGASPTAAPSASGPAATATARPPALAPVPVRRPAASPVPATYAVVAAAVLAVVAVVLARRWRLRRDARRMYGS
jgi:hypothetical protein